MRDFVLHLCRGGVRWVGKEGVNDGLIVLIFFMYLWWSLSAL